MRHCLSFALWGRVCGLVLAMVMVSACADRTTTREGAPLPEVTIGVVGATQPTGTTELLAGHIREGREMAPEGATMEFDTALMKLLREHAGASRTFKYIRTDSGDTPMQGREGGRGTALRHWLEVARDNKVELLIVPQILTWHEREGSPAGVTTPAEVDINFYLIDARDETLLQRSHFAERQQSLSSDLLRAGTFFRRGAKWVTAQELADEAVVKMIKEFGL